MKLLFSFFTPLLIVLPVMGLWSFFVSTRSHSGIPSSVMVSPTASSSHPRKIELGQAFLFVEMADMEAQRVQGLSGRASMPENQGMLFIFPAPGKYGFWMKDMHFPLDFIWISPEKKVVGIDADVLAPPSGTADAMLKIYYPTVPVQYVLEVNAGWAATHGVRKWDNATL